MRILKNKNDLTDLCDELEKDRKNGSCSTDEIQCTKSKLEQYIKGDRSKVLKLKAQIEIKKHERSIYDDISLIFSFINLILIIIVHCFGEKYADRISYGWCILFVLAMVLAIADWSERKYGYRAKWRQYIITVLNDMYP